MIVFVSRVGWKRVLVCFFVLFADFSDFDDIIVREETYLRDEW